MTSRLCVFSKHLSWLSVGEMAEVIRAAGFDGVDLAVRPGGHVEPSSVETDLPQAVNEITKAGLSCPIMVSAINDPTDPETEVVLRTAADCGIRYYRMAYLAYSDDISASLAEHRTTMARLCELNEKYQIHGAYQNHAGTRVGGPVWDIWELIKDLDPRWIGCQYDVRHAVIEGGTSWELGMRLLADHIRCVAVKDAKWSEPKPGVFAPENVPIGSGMVNWGRFAELLPSTAFDGVVSVHFEYPLFEADPEAIAAEERVAKTIAAMGADAQRLRALSAGE